MRMEIGTGWEEGDVGVGSLTRGWMEVACLRGLVRLGKDWQRRAGSGEVIVLNEAGAEGVKQQHGTT
jgi:hypothetical protein